MSREDITSQWINNTLHPQIYKEYNNLFDIAPKPNKVTIKYNRNIMRIFIYLNNGIVKIGIDFYNHIQYVVDLEGHIHNY